MASVLISTSTFDLSFQQTRVDYLAQKKHQILTNPHKRRCSLLEITALLGEGVVGLLAGLEPLTREVLEKAKILR